VFSFIRLLFARQALGFVFLTLSSWSPSNMTIIGIPTVLEATFALILNGWSVVLAALSYKGHDLDFLKMCLLHHLDI